jgi:septal ring-binding cell division protein DamX
VAAGQGAPDLPAIGDGYVVQLGAFRKRDTADQAARDIGREDVRVLHIRRDGQDWHVLVLVGHVSRRDAQEAGQRYLQANPAGATWVRASDGLRELLVPDTARRR